MPDCLAKGRSLSVQHLRTRKGSRRFTEMEAHCRQNENRPLAGPISFPRNRNQTPGASCPAASHLRGRAVPVPRGARALSVLLFNVIYVLRVPLSLPLVSLGVWFI